MPHHTSSGQESEIVPRKLTPKQDLFILEYLKDLNATQAAIRAGYSPETARSIGSENLTKPDIKSYLDQVLGRRKEEIKIEASDVVKELALIGFSRIKNYVRVKNGNVELADTDEMEDGLDACVQSYNQTVTKDGGSSGIKLYDKIKALELLGKHLNLFKEADAGDELANADRVRKSVSSDLQNTLSKLTGRGTLE